MRRALALGLMAMLTVTTTIFSTPPPASASTFDPDSMVFPVAGEYRITDNFGACRDGCRRSHEGVDIMAAKMTPVVAVAAGTINWFSDSCCNLGIDHGNGWQTRYIHLNNDTPGTDDGKGWGIAPGIERGTFVERGQLIGWVGDSGNAEDTAPHLHFELRRNNTAIDAHPYLLNASEVWNGTFRDDDSSIHEADIQWIYEQGITRGCNPPANDRYCPSSGITRGEMAAFLSRALDLADADDDPFVDDDGHRFETEIERLAAAGITRGCNPPDNTRFCPDASVTRGEMAAFLTRALDLDLVSENPFTDGVGHVFEAEIGQLAAVGITKGCNPPDNSRFCPDDTVTRAEMASFLFRALSKTES